MLWQARRKGEQKTEAPMGLEGEAGRDWEEKKGEGIRREGEKKRTQAGRGGVGCWLVGMGGARQRKCGNPWPSGLQAGRQDAEGLWMG